MIVEACITIVYVYVRYMYSGYYISMRMSTGKMQRLACLRKLKYKT